MIKGEFTCIDAHTCGNPVRLVVNGGPSLEGRNMSEKRQHFLKDYDWVRKALMFEPRGHDMMSGSILYPPHDPKNDFAILFIETSGCLPMCGHGTIGTVTIALEEGIIKPKNEGTLLMEAPAGLIELKYAKKGKKVEWVGLKNVPSFLAASGLTIVSDELGELSFDVAYGGNYYAIIDAQSNFKGLQHYKADELISMSRKLRHAINIKYASQFVHPSDPTINTVSHIMWTGEPLNMASHARNAVFYGDKAIDRSPCGTGTSARMAQLHAKGKLKLNQDFKHESIIGSVFDGKLLETTKVGSFEAVVPYIQGWAQVFGHNHIVVDDSDPFAFGFQVI